MRMAWRGVTAAALLAATACVHAQEYAKPRAPAEDIVAPGSDGAVLILRIGYSVDSRDAAVTVRDVSYWLRRVEGGAETYLSVNDLNQLDALTDDLPTPVKDAAWNTSALVVAQLPPGQYEFAWVGGLADGSCATAFTRRRLPFYDKRWKSGLASSTPFKLDPGTVTYLGYIHLHNGNLKASVPTCAAAPPGFGLIPSLWEEVAGSTSYPIRLQTLDTWKIDEAIVKKRYPALDLAGVHKIAVDVKAGEPARVHGRPRL
jgi:hypothetical protein